MCTCIYFVKFFSFRLSAIMEVVRPTQTENTSSDRMASGSSNSSAHIQHGMLQVRFLNFYNNCFMLVNNIKQ